MAEELNYAKYTSKMSVEQLSVFWDALAEAGLVKGDLPLAKDESGDAVNAPDLTAIDQILQPLEHVDVIVACSALEDGSILEILMSQPISKEAPQSHGRDQSKPHTRPNGSKSGGAGTTSGGSSGGTRVKADGPDVKATADDPRILATVAANPKKPSSKSFERYALYKVGMSVAEFIKAGGTKADVQWDVKHNFITLVSPEEWAASQKSDEGTTEQPSS